jgi:hypothetical protein
MDIEMLNLLVKLFKPFNAVCQQIFPILCEKDVGCAIQKLQSLSTQQL